MSQGSRVGDIELIALRGAAKRYRVGGPWVLADVDLEVAPGAVAEPVLATAGGVAGFVFIDAIWIGVALMNSRGDADRHVFTVAAGIRNYLFGRLPALFAISLVIAVAAVAFPTLAAISLFVIVAGLACVSL